MKRLLAIALSLGAASVGLSGCHENLTPYEVCNAFRPHADYDVMWDWGWYLGVTSCNARHGPAGSTLHHTYCLIDDGNHWFRKFDCAGPQNGTGETGNAT